MPRMGSFGGVSWYAYRSKGQNAVFIQGSEAATVVGAQHLDWTGALINDIGIVIVGGDTVSVAPAGFTRITHDTSWFFGDMNVYWKTLNSTDIASGHTVTTANGGGIIEAAVYRGGNTVTAVIVPTFTVGGTHLNVMGGFGKNAASKSIVSYCVDFDTGNTNAYPADWITRRAGAPGAAFRITLTDIKPLKYANGSSVTVNSTPSTSGTACQMLEIT
jgi:hypothetical protein